jgi:hypothetical protein
MTTRLLFAAFHWYLASQSYEHDFEWFNAQYVVLDTCWKLFTVTHGSSLTKGRHAERPVRMCDYFGIPVPEWAVVSGRSSYLSKLRNDLVHEGCYGPGAIGFEFPQEHDNIDYELQKLNCRLLLALLGVRSSYISIPVDSQEQFLLDVE